MEQQNVDHFLFQPSVSFPPCHFGSVLYLFCYFCHRNTFSSKLSIYLLRPVTPTVRYFLLQDQSRVCSFLKIVIEGKESEGDQEVLVGRNRSKHIDALAVFRPKQTI